MIFYFSSTGNGEYIAERLLSSVSDGKSERMVNIADAFNCNEFEFTLSENESLGFVIPTYYWTIPSIVMDFISKLNIKFCNSNYVYSCVHCGVTTGNATNRLKDLLFKRGINLNACYSLRMVDNYTIFFNVTNKERNEKIDRNADNCIDVINAHINRKDKGNFDSLKVIPVFGMIAEIVYNISRTTKKFKVSDNCIGCKKCEQFCPTHSIKIENNRPVWKNDKCTQCLGCIHRCPKYAISYGKATQRNGQYLNKHFVERTSE